MFFFLKFSKRKKNVYFIRHTNHCFLEAFLGVSAISEVCHVMFRGKKKFKKPKPQLLKFFILLYGIFFLFVIFGFWGFMKSESSSEE